jgi:hypothetical protein|nr:MAG TPA: minor capsid protein [Caudoviricetes sp.]
MAKSMVENGFSADKIRVEVMKMLRADKDYQMAVAENTMAYKREVQQIINNTVESAKEAGETLTAEAGDMAWNNDLSMWEQQGEDLTKPNSLSKFVKASSLQTSGALRNLTKTMGFKNTALGTTGVMDMYQREMDLALIKVSTGAFSFDQAVKDCVHRLAQSGLRSIDYESGRSYQLDVAARMAVRTGMSQLSGKITEENLKNSNHDLVITTQHMGSRPDHAVWQNKVFSYSGKSKKYPDFIKETGYGTVTGLKGANCTHDFYPYWEGASIIPEDIKEPDLRTIGGKTYTYYESTQKQRQMERQIRATKREIEATKSIGGDAQDLQNKLRGQMADYKSFSKAAGLKERDNRLRVESGTFILKRKKSKVADHKSADYLMRSHVPGQNVFKERLMTNDVLESMPEKVKKSLQNTIIDIGKDGASQYDYIHDILYVANGAEKSEIIHEIGHVVENKMLDANRVALLRKQMVQDISPNDIIEKIMYDASNNEHKVYIIKSNKFVSEYQGRIYVTDWDEIYDENWNIRDELLWEFISEPFREYIENPNYLKEKYSEFYELIKEIAE